MIAYVQAAVSIALLPILILSAICAVVVAVVVGLVLAARRSKASKWVVGILVVAAMGILVVAAMAVTVPMLTDHIKVPDTLADRRDRTDIQMLAHAQSWTSQAGQVFLADIYPSEAAAAEGLAKHLVTSAIEAAGKDKPVWDVRLSGSASAKALQRAGEAVRNSDAVGNVILSQTAADQRRAGDPPVASIRIDATHERSGGGIVSADLEAGARKMSTSAGFVDKPWVDDLAAFLSRDPKINWLAVAADRPATSQHEARQRAIEIAAARLAGPVRSAIERAHPRVWSPSPKGADWRWLQSTIRADLDSGWPISDQFAQRYRRPYGDVWQHWLLVEASAGKVHHLAARSWSRRKTRRDTWLWRGLSLAGVVGVVLLVYLFLNLATRGYYVWSLRIAAAVLTVIAVLVLLEQLAT